MENCYRNFIWYLLKFITFLKYDCSFLFSVRFSSSLHLKSETCFDIAYNSSKHSWNSLSLNISSPVDIPFLPGFSNSLVGVVIKILTSLLQVSSNDFSSNGLSTRLADVELSSWLTSLWVFLVDGILADNRVHESIISRS